VQHPQWHPSPLGRLIAADWYAERGDQIREAWLREEGQLPPAVTSVAGNGDGHGNGSGSGDGYGHGNGYGDGDADGDADGNGSGSGDGYGHGSGYGSGSGNGSGYGNGNGNGNGDGNGNGNGYCKQPITLIRWEETTMPDIGQYVIVRSRDQGCVCGEYRGHVGREVTLTQARQIFRWSGNRLTLFDVAAVPGSVQVSAEVAECVMLEACGIIPTTAAVEQVLRTVSSTSSASPN
jgi:hypothetical protein